MIADFWIALASLLALYLLATGIPASVDQRRRRKAERVPWWRE